MSNYEKLNYVEFPAKNLPATKAFFTRAFGWIFEDFGPEYIAFTDQGLDGGFYQSELSADSAKGSALLVLLSDDLAATQIKVTESGGKISKAIFSFPGGKRFHFLEPSGNELAVWQKISVE